MPIHRSATGYRKLRYDSNNEGDADNIELLAPIQSYSDVTSTRLDSHKKLLDVSHVETGDESDSASQHRRSRQPAKQKFLAGWRVGVLMSCISATLVCMFNFGVFMWVSKTSPHTTTGNSTTGNLYKGNCEKARRFTVLSHLLVNVLSTLLLDASSYCMQVLSAPNQRELIRAHAARYWLHIGVPSLRNLARIGKDRVLLWLILLCSSAPLHLLFNSVVFLNLQANPYVVIPTTEAWLQNGTYDTSGFQSFNESRIRHVLDFVSEFKINSGSGVTYENTSAAECFNRYNGQYLSDIGHVYLVHQRAPVMRDQLNWFPAFNRSGQFRWLAAGDSMSQEAKEWSPVRFHTDFPFPFISEPTFYPSNGWRCPSRAVQDCDVDNKNEVPADRAQWQPYDSPILYCLIEKTTESCSVEFNRPMAIAVIVSNLIKAVCMALILLVYRKHAPIITVGDAIAGFLEQPDKETRGRCLHDRRLMEAEWNWELFHGAGKDELGIEPERFVPKVKKWYMAPSQGRWIASYFMFTAATIAGFVFMGRALQGMPQNPAKLWKIGFGEVKGNNLLNFSTSFIGSVFLANVPQVVLSYLSLAFEALYTNMFITGEWATYCDTRKPLRVTSPLGQQRSTYWLNVPFRYALPKTVVFGLFHWLTSQSIFTVQITATDIHTRVLDETPTISTCGYSPMAIILTVVIGSFIAIGGIAIGQFKLPSEMPLASSCSAAISAACHPAAGDVDASLKPLQWGAVTHGLENREGGEGVGHCCFSSLAVEKPIPDKLYA